MAYRAAQEHSMSILKIVSVYGESLQMSGRSSGGSTTLADEGKEVKSHEVVQAFLIQP
jgi:hypothetical protein